ncbi:hypothetical protein THARTR1_00560 [Trichoderma harzianum]|uniref:Uncharacterized protein n=1 Tax=Trichoderma harzianum TaxID=5544 RepID=A0A2K0URY7_TRIHA|nr:hypothetical protein THARTR1_00560 [Trichoderma harzianum]
MSTRRVNLSINSFQSQTVAPLIAQPRPSKYRASSRFCSSALVATKSISLVMSHGRSAPKKATQRWYTQKLMYSSILTSPVYCAGNSQPISWSRLLWSNGPSELVNMGCEMKSIGTLTHQNDTVSITDLPSALVYVASRHSHPSVTTCGNLQRHAIGTLYLLGLGAVPCRWSS